jgi:GNAT superfamily N-acetyltransferase
VLGGLAEADAGLLTSYAGGPAGLAERARPLLEQLGTVLRVGPLGSGAAAKLVANAALVGTVARRHGAAAASSVCSKPREAGLPTPTRPAGLRSTSKLDRRVDVRVVPCGAEMAADVHRLTQQAFRPYRRLDPPSGAGRETVATVLQDLEAGGGAVAELEGRLVGCLRWFLDDDANFHVRRVAVAPGLQRRGVGRALMAWAEDEARRHGCAAVTVGVRLALPGNLAFYRRLGYEVTGEHRHQGYEHTTWLAMEKRLVTGF